MQVKIYYMNQWRDISANINTKSNIALQKRCDEAFALGNMVAWLDIPHNIPPYTPLLIDEEVYVCSSGCKRYLTSEDIYVHTIEIMEATSLFCCWILGSKNFSCTGTNKADADKLRIICELMETKYKIHFTYDFSKLIQEQEHTFGPGTTMFDALTEILTAYNCKPTIDFIEPSTRTYGISYVKLAEGEYYNIDYNRVLSIEYNQSSENYCSTLEAEVSNVIDRDNPVVITGLTTRNDTVQMNEDNCILLLPTRIEKINRFYVNLRGSVRFTFYNYKVSDIYGDNVPNTREIKSLYEWCLDASPNDITGSQLYRLYSRVAAELNESFDIETMLHTWLFGLEDINEREDGVYANLQWQSDNVGIAFYTKDITNLVLEEEVYNCLEAKEQPKYCYYKSGDYYISGLNKRYKDDFWNSILGNTTHSFLYYVDSVAGYKEFEDGNMKCILVEGEGSDPSVDPTKSTYDITYIPMVDMTVKTNKETIPINEYGYKPSSRSYDKGSNFVDFNRMDSSIKRTNNSLGLEELSIEYSVVGINCPQPTQRIKYKDVTWYVASTNRIISLKNDVVMINLVRDYNKIADAIGVKTQFSSTKLPLSNIIDRFIYAESDATITINNRNLFVKLSINGKDLFKRVAAMSGTQGVYVIFESIDQYAFDKTAAPEREIPLVGFWHSIITDVPYGDSNNEAVSCDVELCTIEKPHFEDSLKLPYYTGEYTSITSIKNILLYKDARERLLFTIKFPNAVLHGEAVARSIQVNKDYGVINYYLERIESTYGTLGMVQITDNVYLDDLIKVTVELEEGFKMADYWTSYYKVSNEDLVIDINTDIASYYLYINANTYVDNYSVKRISSKLGESVIGFLTSGSVLYYGDILEVSATAKPGFVLKYYSSYEVKSDITINLNASIKDMYLTVNRGPGISEYGMIRTASPHGLAINTVINPGDMVYYGDVITVIAALNEGYELTDWTADSNYTKTFTIDEYSTIDIIPKVKTYSLTVNADSFVEYYEIIRIHSNLQGASIGFIYDGAPIYYGDTLTVSARAEDGYYVEDFIESYQVTSDIFINLSCRQYENSLDPVVEASLTKDSTGGFSTLFYKITNPNAIDVSCQVSIYNSDGSLFDIRSYNIASEASISDGYEVQMTNCTLEVVFISDKFGNRPSTQVQL